MSNKMFFNQYITTSSCAIVELNIIRNISSYELALTDAISVKHFKVTFLNIGTIKNCKERKQLEKFSHFILIDLPCKSKHLLIQFQICNPKESNLKIEAKFQECIG